MTNITMFKGLRQRSSSFRAMSLRRKLAVLIEGAWLIIIFLLPVYFNPLCYNAYYFVKAVALVFLVSALLGLLLAQWFLSAHTVKMGDLSAVIRKSPLQVAAMALALTWVFSTVFSIMPGKSLWGNLIGSVGFLPNLAWIIFFLIVAQRVKDRSQVFRALYTLLISSGIVALVGILQFINHDILPWREYYGRVFSTDGNPLSLSAFLAMAMPITLALGILNWYGWGSQPRSKARFILLMGLFGLQLLCLVFAQYSITLLLFIIGIFVFFALIGIFLQQRTTLALSILAVLLVAVIATVLLGQLMLTENAGPSTDGQGAVAPVAEQVGLSTLGIRVQNWKCAIDVIMDSPEIPFSNDSLHGLRRIIGYGPETFMATSQLRFPADLKSAYTSQVLSIYQPENHYLYLALTLGILGLLAFLALLTVYFWVGLRLLFRGKDKEVILLVAAFVAAIAQYCAHIFFNPSVITPELVFWLILGLTAAMSRIDSAGAQGVPENDCPINVTARYSIPRKLLSALMLVVFVSIGCGLTLPLLLANMKVQDGFRLWANDPVLSLAYFTDATTIGPEQANYHDFLGVKAFSMAGDVKIDPQVKSSLLYLSELAGSAAIQLEPQLAVWRYRLADREMYWIKDGGAAKIANILYLYKEADQLFPGNAVILNKWAWALILTGDYETAGQKLYESAINDPSWAPTVYYRGLLSSHEGKLDEAGGLFVSPVKDKLENVSLFIKFCGQVVPYGEIVLVQDALRAYVKDNNNDWTGFALLGIAEIYSDNPAAALADFKKASMIVPDEDAAMLAAVVKGSLRLYPDFRAGSDEIVKGLMERAATVP